MGLSLNDKKAIVTDISAEVANAQAIVIAEYRGVTVDKLTGLRKKARESGVYLRVLKNTLAQRAVKGTAFEGLAAQMSGPLVYAISVDPVAAAKVIHEFSKGNDKFIVKGGAMRNQVMNVAQVEQLASMPSREELLAQLMATMNAPITKFVRTLNEVPSKFVRTLAALRDKQQEQEAA